MEVGVAARLAPGRAVAKPTREVVGAGKNGRRGSGSSDKSGADEKRGHGGRIKEGVAGGAEKVK
jgi:hypothetical protein